MNDDLTHDQRAILWSMRHEHVAQQNLDAAVDEYPTHADRQARAICKWRECAHLILHHGYTDISTLAAAWQLTPTRTRSSVRNLVRRGALRDVIMPASGKRLLMLTPAGLADARSTLNSDMMCNTNPARIGRTLVAHNLACQRAVIEYNDHGSDCWLHNYSWYAVDALLCQRPYEVRPDVTLAADQAATMIEVELTRKNPARIRKKMEGLANLIIDEGLRTSEAIWYCPPGQIADALARARDRLDGRRGGAADSITVETPDWLGW